MKLENPVSSVLSELLSLIKTFTALRHRQLLMNLRSMYTPDYIPHDLPEADFARAMHHAINEYIQHQRLVFFDSELIRFGANGSFSAKRMPDVAAQALLQKNKQAYQTLIISRLKENHLSEKAAVELLNALCMPNKNGKDQPHEAPSRKAYSS